MDGEGWEYQLDGQAVCAQLLKDLFQCHHSKLTQCHKVVSEGKRSFSARPGHRAELIRQWIEGKSKEYDRIPNQGKIINGKAQEYIRIPYVHKQQFWEKFQTDMEVKVQAGLISRSQVATSYQYFRMVWKHHFPEMKCRRTHDFAKCSECVQCDHIRFNSTDALEVEAAKLKKSRHIERMTQERKTYWNKRKLAVEHPDQAISMIIDGADQNSYGKISQHLIHSCFVCVCLFVFHVNECGFRDNCIFDFQLIVLNRETGMPYFVDKTKNPIAKQKHSLIAAKVHGHGMYCYTISTKFPKDSNVTIEVLWRTLKHLETKLGKFPPILYLQLDNSGRDNKNRWVLSYLNWLVQRKIFQEIYVSFLPVGHTHEDIDAFFGNLYIRFRANDAPSLSAFHDQIRWAWKERRKTDADSTSTHSIHVEHLRSVADFKSWIIGPDKRRVRFINELRNLRDGKILHFKIKLFIRTQDGGTIERAVMETRKYSTCLQNGQWKERRWRTYNTGFELLKTNIPLSFDGDFPPDIQPRPQDPQDLKEIKNSLDMLTMDLERDLRHRCEVRMNNQHIQELKTEFQELCNMDPIPFCWQDDGKFKMELNGQLGTRFNIDAIADVVKDQEENGLAVVSDSDEDEGPDDGDDNGAHAVLMSDKQHKQMKNRKHDVKVAAAGDFIVVAPILHYKPDYRHVWDLKEEYDITKAYEDHRLIDASRVLFWLGKILHISDNKQYLQVQWMSPNRANYSYFYRDDSARRKLLLQSFQEEFDKSGLPISSVINSAAVRVILTKKAGFKPNSWKFTLAAQQDIEFAFIQFPVTTIAETLDFEESEAVQYFSKGLISSVESPDSPAAAATPRPSKKSSRKSNK